MPFKKRDLFRNGVKMKIQQPITNLGDETFLERYVDGDI